MPTYVVEIEWPLSGTDVYPTFWPSAVVRDEDDIPSPPANNHKLLFELFEGTNPAAVSSKYSINFDAGTEPTLSPQYPLVAPNSGSHRLLVSLIRLSDSAVVDTDEELDLNIASNGKQKRAFNEISIEE